ADESELAGDALAGAALHSLRVRGSVLRGLDLTAATAAGIDLADVVVRNGSWANLDAREATIVRLEATGLRGTGAQLPESELTDCTFVDCRLDLTSFRYGQLERIVFRDCRLDEADFLGATLRSVRFEGCVLARASLEESTFERCEIRNCELTDLTGVDRLRGTRMPWPDVVQIAGLLAAASGIAVVD
ncbi:MAG: pentapeptide repeat-containing protein, partial [Gaiellaceae bacterium]